MTKEKLDKPILKIDEDALDDWELVEEMQAMIENNDPLKSIGIFKRLVGLEQYEELKKYLKARDGKVKTGEMLKELEGIMAESELKK
ncbi:hypothetical protein [Ileibacterium valens]|uniref:hypothetical protein n=1 Tax=Ileibacterium valens TaxID=1862668 RepID=UPI002355DFEB|nr:hypothetical protein [Ileibacterium valens]